MSEDRLRKGLVDAARRMNSLGLNRGTSGNLSARLGDEFLITPSATEYESMQPEDIIAMDFEGNWRARRKNLQPASEWRFHRDILQERPEFGAVIHAHPPHATALACQRRDIPPFHYMVAMAGGSHIKCSRYETFGSEALSKSALEALGERKACLLAHHGMIACGATLGEALALAVEVEGLAQQYLLALQIGEPPILDESEMERVLDKFAAGYGLKSAREDE